MSKVVTAGRIGKSFVEMFAAYPIMLKASDIADAMQICENTAYEMMRQSGLVIPCGRSGKSKRVARDEFFSWVESTKKTG